jgi:nitrite reductase/ring-hydroxylating ferredoxin subunit
MLDRIRVIVVRKHDGSVCALRDVCPHMGAALSDGNVQKLVVGDRPLERRMSERLVVRCPWHGHEFDTDSGRCAADRAQRVRVYNASVENGIVVIER